MWHIVFRCVDFWWPEVETATHNHDFSNWFKRPPEIICQTRFWQTHPVVLHDTDYSSDFFSVKIDHPVSIL